MYFTAAAVIPLLLFGYFADRYLLHTHLAQVEGELNLHTLDIKRETERILQQVSDSQQLVRAHCSRILADDPARIDGLLQDSVNSFPEMLSIFLLDEHQRIRHLGLAEILSAGANDYRGLDYSAQPQLAGVLDGDPEAPSARKWSEVNLSLATGEPSISLTLPMNGWTLMSTVSLGRLGELLSQRITQREGLEFAIADRHGTLVAHSNPELVRQRTSLLAVHPEIREGLASGRAPGSQRQEDGSLLESQRLIDGQRWLVYASLPREAALAPLRQVRMQLLLIVSTSILLGLALAAWLARRIARPLRELCETAGALSSAKYDRAVQVKEMPYREVAELAQAFRTMAETVQQREQILTDSGEQFRFLVDGMGEGLLMLDRNGLVITANRAAARIFGREQHELLGMQLPLPEWTVIAGDEQARAADAHPALRSLQDGLPVDNQILGLQHRDGRELWLQVNGRPIRDDLGEVQQVLMTFADVSSMKTAEESLRLSKLRFQELYQQFSALLEGITDRVVLISPQWQLIWTNQGLDGGSVGVEGAGSGHCCYEHFFARREPCPGCPAMRVFASAEPAFGEMSDAGGRSWQLKAFPVFGTGGQVRNVVLIAEDISDKRDHERQRSRAAQLAALGELAAGVAHEINNPISGVINYAQLILGRAAEGSREHELAQRIIKEGDRIATIVRELLIFAREESSDIRIVSLREALAEALALCDAQLRKEGIVLHIDLPADIPRVQSRSHQIQQLFLNLISNSRHALCEKYPEQHPDKRLQISGRAVENGGRTMVRLQIRDHGTGIPAGLLEKVMNPFVTTKPAGVGTGLGLSISFEIVKKHEGTLSIASEHGHWTEVTIDLPAVKPTAAPAPAQP